MKAQAIAGVTGDDVCDGTRRSRPIQADSVVRRRSGYVDAVAAISERDTHQI